MNRPVDRSLLIALSLSLCASLSSAEPRFRTPAEIELRRAEVARQIAVLVEEELQLQDKQARLLERLAGVAAEQRARLEQTRDEIRSRLEAIVVARAALSAEAEELARIRTRSATGPLSRADSPGLSPVQVPGSAGQVSAANAFNPAITVIPDGLYYYDNAGGEAPTLLRDAERFGAAGADIDDARVPRGFSLREVEVAFSGAVDPYFDVWATFGIGDGAIETEEVYVQTRRFLPGTQIRFGQFYSGIGHLNRQHRHQWDFADQALLYETLFGTNLREVGVQVTWLPVLPFYMQMGFEALQGDNAFVSNQLSDQYPELLDDTPGPRLFTSFVKVSPELGYSNTLQAGFSIGRSRSHQEATTSDQDVDVFDGTSWFISTDWIWRRDSPKPYGERDLTLQGEYVYRSKTLELVDAADLGESASQQDGLYAQVVYGIGPRWTIAGRFDVIGLRNQLEMVAATTQFDASTRYSANVTFNPTEFSRLRAQYNYGRVSNGEPVGLHQFYVQFQMSLGVHGAHAF